ncbi:hypothetical protein J6590_010305 [Homalodisca vitripennis]|nr:hypothetical protein J6590_010305 [Homalodisca vitripennis]
MQPVETESVVSDQSKTCGPQSANGSVSPVEAESVVSDRSTQTITWSKSCIPPMRCSEVILHTSPETSGHHATSGYVRWKSFYNTCSRQLNSRCLSTTGHPVWSVVTESAAASAPFYRYINAALHTLMTETGNNGRGGPRRSSILAANDPRQGRGRPSESELNKRFGMLPQYELTETRYRYRM